MGFEQAVGEDVEDVIDFAKLRNFKVRRLIFDEPEHFARSSLISISGGTAGGVSAVSGS